LGAVRAFVLTVPLFIAALMSHACGVSFSSNFEGTELFEARATLSGTPAGPGSEGACTKTGVVLECSRVSRLTVHLAVTNGYPVPVRVACFIEDQDHTLTDDEKKVDFQDRVPLVAETVLPAEPGRKPGDKNLKEQQLDLTFAVPAPGFYFIACHTPAAPDNGPYGLNVRILA
jgi:hypothetical protein